MEKKFFVHRTDENGSGYYGSISASEVKEFSYDYDADMYKAVKMLIEIGVIKEEEVLLLDVDEIYSHLKVED